MSEPIWNQILDRARQGGVRRRRLRRARGLRQAARRCSSSMSAMRSPATSREPILESIKRWRNSCGAESWVAIGHIRKLIDKAHEGASGDLHHRRARVPICGIPAAGRARTRAAAKQPKTTSNRNGYEIVDEIAPAPKDLVIYKQKPSGFFGTPMAGYLTQLQCDSVIVTGTTTSGCVRATVRRRVQPQLSRRHGGGGLLRSQPGEPRDHAVRSRREIRRHRQDGRGARAISTRCHNGMFDLPRGVPFRLKPCRFFAAATTESNIASVSTPVFVL